MKNIFLTIVALCVLSACKNEPVEPAPNPIDTTTYALFPAASGTIWRLQKSSSDTAFFRALDTVAAARLAPTFWDTNATACFTLKAIPVNFTYWVGNMKKTEEFALGITDSGYVFGANKNPMIDPNYRLDDSFYSVLFFIPSKTEAVKPVVVVADSLTYGSGKYLVKQSVTWFSVAADTFEVTYNAKREKVDAYQYSEKFGIAKKSGFVEFRGYK